MAFIQTSNAFPSSNLSDLFLCFYSSHAPLFGTSMDGACGGTSSDSHVCTSLSVCDGKNLLWKFSFTSLWSMKVNQLCASLCTLQCVE